MTKPKYRRTQKIVDAKLQVGLTLRIVGWLYAYVLLFALLANAHSVVAMIVADADSPSYVAAVDRMRGFASMFLAPMLLTFLAMGVHSLLLTHKIAGPAYRLKQVLKGVSRGIYPSAVKLREGDFLVDVADELGNALGAVREERARVRRMNADVLAAAQRLVASLDESAPVAAPAHEVLDAVEALEAHLACDDEDTAEYRVPMPASEVEEVVGPAPVVAAAE